ncbi:MAG: hypothetical protein HQL42_15585 [Alphaproteobacteria bacterium]|nr:hypothetical protein [Alphaproteobacteria bacterium]
MRTIRKGPVKGKVGAKKVVRTGARMACATAYALQDTGESKLPKATKVRQYRTLAPKPNYVKIDKIITTPVPEESVMALARVVAAANLAENGEVKVTSTKGMNRVDFLALLKKSAPAT